MSQVTAERITSLPGHIGFARLALPKLKTVLEIGCPDGARVLAVGRFMIVLSSRKPITATSRRPGEL